MYVCIYIYITINFKTHCRLYLEGCIMFLNMPLWGNSYFEIDHVCVYMCVCLSLSIYIYIYICTFIYIYIYMCVDILGLPSGMIRDFVERFRED